MQRRAHRPADDLAGMQIQYGGAISELDQIRFPSNAAERPERGNLKRVEMSNLDGRRRYCMIRILEKDQLEA